MRLPRHPLKHSKLFLLPHFERPHSDQCLRPYRLTGGASALRYILPQDQRSPEDSDYDRRPIRGLQDLHFDHFWRLRSPIPPPFVLLFPCPNRFAARIQIETTVNLPSCIYTLMLVMFATISATRTSRLDRSDTRGRQHRHVTGSLISFFCIYSFRFASPYRQMPVLACNRLAMLLLQTQVRGFAPPGPCSG